MLTHCTCRRSSSCCRSCSAALKCLTASFSCANFAFLAISLICVLTDGERGAGGGYECVRRRHLRLRLSALACRYVSSECIGICTHTTPYSLSRSHTLYVGVRAASCCGWSSCDILLIQIENGNNLPDVPHLILRNQSLDFLHFLIFLLLFLFHSILVAFHEFLLRPRGANFFFFPKFLPAIVSGEG